MTDQLPIIIVTNPEGQQTFSLLSPKEVYQPLAYPHPDLPPMTSEEWKIIFAGTQPSSSPQRSIFRKISIKFRDTLPF